MSDVQLRNPEDPYSGSLPSVHHATGAGVADIAARISGVGRYTDTYDREPPPRQGKHTSKTLEVKRACFG